MEAAGSKNLKDGRTEECVVEQGGGHDVCIARVKRNSGSSVHVEWHGMAWQHCLQALGSVGESRASACIPRRRRTCADGGSFCSGGLDEDSEETCRIPRLP
jgi:hypothetical protein